MLEEKEISVTGTVEDNTQELTDTIWESNHLQTIKLIIDEMINESKAPVFTAEELL